MTLHARRKWNLTCYFNAPRSEGPTLPYAYLIVTAMAVFAATAAAAFAWAGATGQFRDLARGAQSIFWDDDPPRGEP